MYDYGIDLDDIFNNDTENIIFEFSYEVPMLKSAICRKLAFDIKAALKLTERRKNIDI